MITKNFKAFLANMIGSRGSISTKGVLPVKDTTGNIRYFGFRYSNFPNSVQSSVNFSGYSGIVVGTGTTPPTEDDYILENRITSGLTGTDPTKKNDVDSNGNPYIEFVFTLRNTTETDITVHEIGYAQNIYASTTLGGTDSNSYTLLFDRTVLETPVTVPANGTAAIKYTLKTIIGS